MKRMVNSDAAELINKLADTVEQTTDTLITIGTNLVVDGSITTDDAVTAESLAVSDTITTSTLTASGEIESGSLSVSGNATIDDLDVESSAAISGDLEVTGSITGGEIIETMSGYSFNVGTSTEYTLDFAYVGAVKNGNKLTLAAAFTITKASGATSSNPTIGYFVVPTEIYNSLYPSTVGAHDFLDNKVLQAWETLGTKVDVVSWLAKSSSTRTLHLVIQNANTLTEETAYFIRYEVTFLLSDSLVS